MLRHLDDLASDFSVFHRVDDMGALPARAFFALAERLSAYQGIVSARAAIQAAEEDLEPSGPYESREPPPDQVTPRAVLESDSAFKGVFSFGTMTPA